MAPTGLAKVQQFLKLSTGFEKSVLHNVKVISADKGNCVSEVTIAPEQTNILKVMHGGFATTLVDVFSTCALLTHAKGDCAHVTISLNVEFIKGAKAGDTILVDAKTLKVGKTLAFLEIDVKDKPSGAMLVKGSHTKFLKTNKKMM